MLAVAQKTPGRGEGEAARARAPVRARPARPPGARPDHPGPAALALATHPGPVLQRCPGCGGTCGGGGSPPPGRTLRISAPDDPYEREADIVAGTILRMPDPAAGGRVASAPAALLQRRCAECEAEEEAGENLQRKESAHGDGGFAPAAVHETLRSPGMPLDPGTRSFFEMRFGRDLGGVRLHTDAQAAASARAVDALAYTVGPHVVFGGGQYAPATPRCQHLLAHELTHAVQQGAAGDGIVHRAPAAGTDVGAGTATPGAEETGATGAGAGGAACPVPSYCPSGFCVPMSPMAARALRAASRGIILAGIRAFVDSRVVPLWETHIDGGTAPLNLSSTFGADFTTSADTATTTDFLVGALQTALEGSPPAFPPGSIVTTVDIPTTIPGPVADIDDPASAHQMNFFHAKEIPGNIAGGIGKDEAANPVGAMPSPFDDARIAAGTALVTLNPDSTLTIIPSIAYTVRDTIDLCPGDCGAPLEWAATIPLSRMEASGISGDVPFTVEFPAPPRVVRTRAVTPPPPPTPPSPGPPTSSAVVAQTTASVLHIRQGPSTATPIVGRYPRNTVITIECQVAGEAIEGNDRWDRTDKGFVSDRYVQPLESAAPGACPP